MDNYKKCMYNPFYLSMMGTTSIVRINYLAIQLARADIELITSIKQLL